jgi:hypothetical protein
VSLVIATSNSPAFTYTAATTKIITGTKVTIVFLISLMFLLAIDSAIKSTIAGRKIG